MADAGITDADRELAKVTNDLAIMVEVAGEPYWAEELIPPMTEDPDEIVENMKLSGHVLPAGQQMGFTLWRGDDHYRVSVSKIVR